MGGTSTKDLNLFRRNTASLIIATPGRSLSTIVVWETQLPEVMSTGEMSTLTTTGLIFAGTTPRVGSGLCGQKKVACRRCFKSQYLPRRWPLLPRHSTGVFTSWGTMESFTDWTCREALLKLVSDQGMVFSECRSPPVPESLFPSLFAQFQ